MADADDTIQRKWAECAEEEEEKFRLAPRYAGPAAAAPALIVETTAS